MPPPTKAPSLEELYPGISTTGKSDAQKDAELSQAYPGMVTEPSTGEAAKEVLLGAGQGAVRDAPVVTGGLAGARFGLATAPIVAPILGPLTPLYPAATTALGLGAGYFAGQQAERMFPAVDREDLIPYREGGKTFGSSIATAPAAFGLPVMTGNRVAQFVSSMGQAARARPKTFMLSEGITAGAMGVAGGAAESYFPGEEGVRFGAELGAGVATGVLSPTKLLLTGVDSARAAINSAKGPQRTDRLEAKAANLLLKALETHGDDPDALIKALRAQIPSGVSTPTSGQKTGSRALMDLEASLSAHHAQFGGETKEQGRKAIAAYQELIARLRNSGDPALFRAAAELRDRAFTTLLENRLSMADARSAGAIAKISRDTPEARLQIGEIVKSNTEEALRAARDFESNLWTAAIKDLTRPEVRTIGDKYLIRPEVRLVAPTIIPQDTVQDFLNRVSTVGPALYESSVAPPVRNVMEAFGVDKDAIQNYNLGKLTQEYLDTGVVPSRFMPTIKQIPVGDLVNYRSTLLKMAREAAGGAQYQNAELYSTLANGMLSDLSALNNAAFDEARSFSKSLNDVFTRTFAKTASETGDLTRSGAQRVPAEILVSNAFGVNADVTAMRMAEIEDAVKFMRTQYDDAVSRFGKNSPQAQALKPAADEASRRVTSVLDAQTRILRLAAAESVQTVYDEAKGTYVQKLNFPRLTKFAQQNAPLLEKLGIMSDLRDAAHASNLLIQVKNANSVMDKTVRNQAAFAKALAVESPSKAVGAALSSKFPAKSIEELVKFAMAEGSGAVNGLKSAIMDYAYTKAGANSDSFSVRAFEQALFGPIGQNKPSIVQLLRTNGLMKRDEINNIKRLLIPMSRVEIAIANNVPYDDIIKGADPITDLGLRFIGARIGTAASPGPASLIAASAGSKAVRQIFDSLPNMTLRQILENAAKDPEAMALLLERGRSEGQRINIANKLINFLGKMGVAVGNEAVTPALNYLSPEEPRPSQFRGGEQSPLTPQGQASRMLLRMPPPAPSTRGVPFLQQQPPAKGSAAPPPSGAPTNANARSMLQSLFPFDTVTAMAAAQPPQQPQ